MIPRTLLIAGVGLSLLLSCKAEKPAEGPPPIPVAEQKTAPKPVAKVAAKAPATTAAPAEFETVVGHVKSFSKKAKTLKIAHGDGAVIIKWDASTKLVDATAFTQLKPPTKVSVKYAPGQPAAEIKRMLVQVPADMLISTDEVAALIGSKTPHTLVDARPKSRYLEGHIPTAMGLFANDVATHLDALPKNKGELLVFYCGGVTCGLSPKAAKIAKANGYTNVKAFRAGLPGWKKSGRPMVLEPVNAKAKLGPNAVFIDLRDAKAVAEGHVKGAVHFDEVAFLKLSANVASAKIKRLPGVADAKAPIYIYGATADDPKAVALWRSLKKWGYTQHALLDGGYAAWAKAGLPTAKGAAPTTFTYVKKKVPGAATPAEVKAAVAAGAQLVDVRGAAEATNKVPGALNVPLDDLEARLAEIPKTKPVIFYCGTGIRASMAYETATAKGYTNVTFLDDLASSIRPKGAAPTAAPAGEEAEGC